MLGDIHCKYLSFGVHHIHITRVPPVRSQGGSIDRAGDIHIILGKSVSDDDHCAGGALLRYGPGRSGAHELGAC